MGRSRFLELRTAARWGIAPSAFWSLEVSDRAYMMAFVLAETRMQAWEHQVAEEKAKRQRRGK